MSDQQGAVKIPSTRATFQIFRHSQPLLYRDAMVLAAGGEMRSFAQVPRELVLSSPSNIPRIVWESARVYYLPWFEYKGDLVPVRNFVSRLQADGETFWGTARYPQLKLLEIWEDCGDDGHVEYRLEGLLWTCEEFPGIPYDNRELPPFGVRELSQWIYDNKIGVVKTIPTLSDPTAVPAQPDTQECT